MEEPIMVVKTNKDFVEQELTRAAKAYERIATGNNELWERDEEHIRFLKQVSLCRILVMRLTNSWLPEIKSSTLYTGYNLVVSRFNEAA